MAHVLACSQVTPSLMSARVAKEYIDIFTTNLPDIPLDRGITLPINVELSTKPISITLIRWPRKN